MAETTVIESLVLRHYLCNATLAVNSVFVHLSMIASESKPVTFPVQSSSKISLNWKQPTS
jgi:hypothetical protein